MFELRTLRRLATSPSARRLTVLALATALLPGLLAAQPNGPFVDARRGDGELERSADSRDTAAIVECAVRLGADGAVWIEARSRNERFEFRGTWRPGEREQRLWTITEAMGQGANAEGWMLAPGGRMKQVEIVGRWSGGRKLRLHFVATGDLPPRAPVWSGVDSERAGDGTLERGRGRQPLRRARVVLAPNGRAEIVLWGLDEASLAGRWVGESDDRVRFTADAGFAGRPGAGGGTIELRERRLERLTLSGTSGGLDYRLDFRAGAEPPAADPVRPGRQELSEEAGFNLEGGDYTSVYFESLRECQTACRRDDRCRAYTYNTRSRVCYLKERAGRLERRQDTVSGVKSDGR